MPTTHPPAPRRRGPAAAALVTAALTAGGGVLVAVPTVTAHAADSPTTVQVSVRTGGFSPGDGANNHGSAGPTRVSRDGRYVVFAASGPVAAGHRQLEWQVFRRDRHLGVTTLVSKSSSEVMGNAGSRHPSISADGQVVAFHSDASNLVAGDTNATSDIFVHDVSAGTTTRASVTSTGAQVPLDQTAGSNVVGPPTISANGRWVGFTSRVQGYTPDDGATTTSKAYLHDRTTGAIEVVSRTGTGAVVSAHVATPVSLSEDAERVAFQSLDDMAGGSGTAISVFVRDRAAGTTAPVGGREWRDLRHSISADGRTVVYDTSDSDQVSGDSNGRTDVFVHDLTTGTKQRVSVASDGTQGNDHSTGASVSADGRYVSFESDATNLVAGDTNGTRDVFRHDRVTGQTVRVSVTHRSAQSSDTRGAGSGAVSGNGQHVLFESYDATLSPAGTQGYGQVFVRDLKGAHPALFARLGKTPARAVRKETYRVPTLDIRTGPALQVTWTPTGQGRTVQQSAPVTNNAFTLRAPQRAGKYTLTVRYDGNLLGTRTVTVPRPSAKKLAKSVKKSKKLTVRTVGVKRGAKVKVVFTPQDRTKGAKVVRTARTNPQGVLKVAGPKRAGSYRVVVTSGGATLRKATVRVR